MQIRVEPLSLIHKEVAALIDGYYADTNAQDGIPPLNMDWPFFIGLEQGYKLILIAARDDGELVGVNMYMLTQHPQHKSMTWAMCNTLAVATKHRGKGIGTMLVEAGLAYLKAHTDVKVVTHHFRTIYDTKPLFPKLGFDLAEHTYMKVL
jgi:GNAT superfamily N-acetyltransferase